jgi:hypothetical protein
MMMTVKPSAPLVIGMAVPVYLPRFSLHKVTVEMVFATAGLMVVWLEYSFNSLQ